MRKWERYVREHLPLREMKSLGEERIIRELADHLEDLYHEALARGLEEDEAEEIVRRRIGDLDVAAAELAQKDGGGVARKVDRWMEAKVHLAGGKGGIWTTAADLAHDLRLSFRGLRRSLGFSLVVLLTLAVGIGANTAIFSLVSGILLEPLPFDEPERLVAIWNRLPGVGIEKFATSAAIHFTYEEQSETLEEVGLWTAGQAVVTGLEEPANERAIWVTEGTFRVLRARPILGRLFTHEDDTPAAPRTVILGHGYWQQRFGGDPGVIGRTLRVDGDPSEVIGVMPAGFRIADSDAALYIPLRIDRSTVVAGQFWYGSIGRLAPGVTLAQVHADLDRLMPVAIESFPGGMTLDDLDQAQLAPVVVPLKQEIVGSVQDVLWLLLGAGGVVLVIVCANLANLFLVRAEARDQELAVRCALGAKGRQIAGQYLMEGVLLAFLGGLAGLGVARGGLRLLAAVTPGALPRMQQVSLDPAVLAFAFALSVLAGVFFGLFPILRWRSESLIAALREGGRGAHAGRKRHRTRNSLVVGQIALALVLLAGAGLLVRTFGNLKNVDPGFGGPDEVLTFRLSIPSAEISDLEEMTRTHELIAQNFAALPGVVSVGLTSRLPMGSASHVNPVWVEEFPMPEGVPVPTRQFTFVSGGYFQAMQIPVVWGRPLTWSDSLEHRPVVAVSESFARVYWSSPADAVGKRISTGRVAGESGWREIVGVVGDVRDDGVHVDSPALTYWPISTPNPWKAVDGAELLAQRSLSYAIRSSRTGTPGLLQEVRQAIAAVNPNLAVDRVAGMDEIVSRSMARTTFMLVMLGIAAAVALLLAGVGVYGVVSYVVSRQTREIGLRIALGAGPTGVIGLILKRGLVLAVGGVALGLAASYGLTRVIAGFLFGVSPMDPLTYATVAMCLIGISLMASYVPARRAAGVDPVEALKTE